MDFTSAYPHSCADAIAFSGGSMLFATVIHELEDDALRSSLPSSSKKFATYQKDRPRATSTIVVRASATLQVIRAWSLEGHVTQVEWSSRGEYLLAIAPSQASSSSKSPQFAAGIAYVLALDPSVEANDGSDSGQGWVARIDAGLEGLSVGQWMPSETSSIILFSVDEVSSTSVKVACES